MTELSIADYCSGCPNINPEVSSICTDVENEVYITCANEKQCRVIVKYLERKMKDELQRTQRKK